MHFKNKLMVLAQASFKEASSVGDQPHPPGCPQQLYLSLTASCPGDQTHPPECQINCSPTTIEEHIPLTEGISLEHLILVTGRIASLGPTGHLSHETTLQRPWNIADIPNIQKLTQRIIQKWREKGTPSKWKNTTKPLEITKQNRDKQFTRLRI